MHVPFEDVRYNTPTGTITREFYAKDYHRKDTVIVRDDGANPDNVVEPDDISYPGTSLIPVLVILAALGAGRTFFKRGTS